MKPLLKFAVEHLKPEQLASRQDSCLLLPVLEGVGDDTLLKALDPSGRLADLLEQGAGSLSVPLLPEGVGAGQLLLTRLKYGEKGPDQMKWLAKLRALLQQLIAAKVQSACLVVRSPGIQGVDLAWAVEQVARLAEVARYKYTNTLSSKEENGDEGDKLETLTLLVEDSIPLEVAESAQRRGAAVGLGINTARELGNLPPNICNPTFLAETARNLAKEHDCLELELLSDEQLQAEGMRTLLSVAEGSRQPAFLFRLRYRGSDRPSPVGALVGKGVTFDTGGISLKPSANMADMKYDMSGAGAVIGVMRALAELQPQINVDGIVATVENMPGGRATRPGDVVTSMSGQTVEILNTDAEGRLILCDALTWAAKEKPDMMIDIATLTGACVVALGHEASGLYSNDDALAGKLLQAAADSGDRAWRMPLWDEYDKMLKSRYADVANIGGQGAGSITAACFLQRFVGKTSWAHLDVAGTAHMGGNQRASTGRPVGLLMQFVLDNL